MSHRHFCDYRGHDWQCEGTNARPPLEPFGQTPCMCIKHGVSMEEGDHSNCPVELRVCPEHSYELLREMNGFGAVEMASDVEEGDPVQFMDPTGNPTVGWCLWCNKDLYTSDEVWGHNGDGYEGCTVRREFISRQASPDRTDLEGEA